MSQLDEFTSISPDAIEVSRPAPKQLRSKAVCLCGHSEGAHTSRRAGLGGGFEDCRIGKVRCECKGFVAVIEPTSVLEFRARPGKPGAGHPLLQGIKRMLDRNAEAEVRKLAAWVCAAPGCGSTGQLTPLYLEGAGDAARPVPRDTGTTVLVCNAHLGGA